MEQVKTADKQIDEFLPEIYKKLEWLSREELIKHFVSVEFNRFLEYYKNAPDLNVSSEKGSDIRKKKQGSKSDYTNIYINIGNKKGMDPARLIALINEAMRKRDIPIGKIDVQRNFSFFEIDQAWDQKLLQAFEGAVYEDQPVVVEIKNQKMRPSSKPN